MRNNTVEQYIHKLFHKSADVIVEKHTLFQEKNTEQMVLVLCDGLVDQFLLVNRILPEIQHNYFFHGIAGIEKKRTLLPNEFAGPKTKNMSTS